MAKQFDNVVTSWGAPMGRHSVPDLSLTRRGVRLFRVRLDAGGYDDGGAYWGAGAPLWCAQDADGGRQFVRATSRIRAAFVLGIQSAALARPLPTDDAKAWCYALLDGRAPWPTYGDGRRADRGDLFAWLDLGRVIASEPRAS